MDGQSERFLDDLISHQAFATDKKYRKGQKEHGGKLWEKPGMLRNIEFENTDQSTYAFALRKQLNRVLEYQLEGSYEKATEIIKMILAEPKD